jgi:sulfonate transport system ATP-binding protein
VATGLPTRLVSTDPPVAGIRHLTRAFGNRTILDNLDLDIERGEFVALLGRSGSGKSTLLRALAGLDQHTTGDLTVAGTVSVAFQEPRLLPWKRVIENVALGLDGPVPRTKRKAREALEEVGLGALGDAWPLTLSGGEAQRASLARALVREPGLLLLDEPFSALDALTRIAMHRLVLDLWNRHREGDARLSVLLVTHDVDEALLLADRVLVLREGRIGHESRVPADRPRHAPDLHTLRSELLDQLGVHEGRP